jgi:glutathione S-transferase
MSDPRETRLPHFLALNHRGKTPVFVDTIPASPADSTDGSIPPTTINVNESLAILQYLETYHKLDIPLLPPLSQRKERALALARMQETENLHYAYDDLEDAHFAASNKTEPLTSARRAELILAVHKELDFWEVYAAQAEFIAGKAFGLADCAFFPILAYMVHRGFEWRRPRPRTDNSKPRRTAKGKIIPGHDEVDAWPHLKAYFERVWNRNDANGCAQKAQPDGWHGRGKANVWRGTTGNAKPLKKSVPRPSQSG